MTTAEACDGDTLIPLAADFEPASREAWLKLVDKALKGASFEKRMVSRTADGLEVQPLYTRAEDLPGATTNIPGRPPFVRGTRSATCGLGWDIRQFHAGADPKGVNANILDDLAGGAMSIALQIGPTGLPSTDGALAQALEGVLLDICPVSLLAGEKFTPAAEQLMALWTARGIALGTRRGHFNADPLGTLAMTGRLEKSLDEALDEAVALAAATREMPGVTALLADGDIYHCAGATEAQELAAMLATLVAYLRAAERAGLAPPEALPKIAVGLALDTDQFLGLAKLRAARRLVWQVADAAGAGSAAASVRFDAITSWRMMAKRDPWTNILRTTVACAAGALGGADSITVLPFTFALGQTDALARRIARNIQIVCQEESNLGRVIDPAGGSWYVEKLTNDLARKAWALFQDIEREGGMAGALQSGFVQTKIAESAAVRAQAIATRRVELTGVSAFPLLGDDGVTAEPWPEPPPVTGQAAITIKPLQLSRLAEPFEALRDAADAHAAATGKPFEIFLASLGPVIEHNVRSTWIKNFFAAGGIEAKMTDGYATPEEAVTAFKTSGLKAACIASSDAIYAEFAQSAARALKAAGAKLVLMAGRPGDEESALRAAGVDVFLAAGCDAVAALRDLQARLS